MQAENKTERENTCLLSDISDGRTTTQTWQGELEKNILKMLDIEENYYKSKYKEPVSDFPSDNNQKFAKEMDEIFR